MVSTKPKELGKRDRGLLLENRVRRLLLTMGKDELLMVTTDLGIRVCMFIVPETGKTVLVSREELLGNGGKYRFVVDEWKIRGAWIYIGESNQRLELGRPTHISVVKRGSEEMKTW